MTDQPQSGVGSLARSDDPNLEALASEALSEQVAHLRNELVLAWEETAERDRTISELREVIATRNEQIRAKDVDLQIHADYIHRLTRLRRMVPGWLRSSFAKRQDP